MFAPFIILFYINNIDETCMKSLIHFPKVLKTSLNIISILKAISHFLIIGKYQWVSFETDALW